jgi:hypothetical protein
MSLETSANTATYTGPLTAIPADGPPGLRLLAALYGPIGALDPPVARAAIERYCAPGARVVNNGTPAVPLLSPPPPAADGDGTEGERGGGVTQGEKRARRAAALSRVERELRRAVDVELEDGAREVWWHGRTGHVFRADAEKAEAAGIEPEILWMAEAGVWRVERVPPGHEGEVGEDGWWVVGMMSWHDRTGIRQKRAELGV